MHHIVEDGWSLGLFGHEAGRVVRGVPSAPGERAPAAARAFNLPISRTGSGSGGTMAAMAAQLAYWQERLADPARHGPSYRNHPRGASELPRRATSPGTPGAIDRCPHRARPSRDGSTRYDDVGGFQNARVRLHGAGGSLRRDAPPTSSRRASEDAIGLFCVNTVIPAPTSAATRRVRRCSASGRPRSRRLCEPGLVFRLVQTFERERGVTPASLCRVMMVMQDAMQHPLQRAAGTLSLLGSIWTFSTAAMINHSTSSCCCAKDRKG